jgi:hypothetical protein
VLTTGTSSCNLLQITSPLSLEAAGRRVNDGRLKGAAIVNTQPCACFPLADSESFSLSPVTIRCKSTSELHREPGWPFFGSGSDPTRGKTCLAESEYGTKFGVSGDPAFAEPFERTQQQRMRPDNSPDTEGAACRRGPFSGGDFFRRKPGLGGTKREPPIPGGT